jgi:hypothetical protein
MPDLRSTQALFVDSVLNGDGSVLPYVVDTDAAAGGRLSIYINNVFNVAVAALSETYRGVRKLLGEACFDDVAHRFVKAKPPTSAWLDNYGSDFPAFLSESSALAELVYLVDVAKLEWLINRALHAEDGPAMDDASLFELDDALAARVRFKSHPALEFLQSPFPVDQILAAVMEGDDSDFSAIRLANDPIWLVVHRPEQGLSVRRVDERTWRFTRALSRGLRLDQAIQLAPDHYGELVATCLLNRHFSSFSIDNPV